MLVSVELVNEGSVFLCPLKGAARGRGGHRQAVAALRVSAELVSHHLAVGPGKAGTVSFPHPQCQAHSRHPGGGETLVASCHGWSVFPGATPPSTRASPGHQASIAPVHPACRLAHTWLTVSCSLLSLHLVWFKVKLPVEPWKTEGQPPACFSWLPAAAHLASSAESSCLWPRASLGAACFAFQTRVL